MSANNANKKRSQELIDENLKMAFSETLDEGIPDRFKDLLAKLKDTASDKSSEEPKK
ncbi:NepR family anti-sigma factor [Aliiroseovarius sp. F47248L]|uniref:NepR family anti-sigma factor n=1 Tax=Aliiroseovarius sp. F47248L TaxID=2926420 RepID=UPI001FF1462D|nr:NepR family anti-sigma factor [Aliiroseovarius sp. F47248L]MCK0139251.1 regulator [Aliiroseovarius sp. F47248L]